jgi:hypothetical protein
MVYDRCVFGVFLPNPVMNTEEEEQQPTIVIKGRAIGRKEIDKFVNEGIFLASESGNEYIPPYLVLRDRSSFVLTKDEARKVVMFMREYPDES